MPLKIIVPGEELYDPVKERFYMVKCTELSLEHSLISLSKWEMKHKKPFLPSGPPGLREESHLSTDELLDYIRCMTLTQNVDPNVYNALTPEVVEKIRAYMEDPMTATTISQKNKKRGPNRVITSELIYAWMAILRIPYQCEKWHLNRLLTLIQVTSLEQDPDDKGRKMSPQQAMSQQKALNAARRRKFKSKG